MNKSNINTPFVSLGTSSLMVVFLVLCLSGFGVLSLSGAKSDYNLTEKAAGYTQDYYRGNTAAEKVLCKIDAQLEKIYTQGTYNTQEEYLLRVKTELDGCVVDDVKLEVDNRGNIRYEVSVNDVQNLQVLITVTNPRQMENYYSVTAWKTIQTEDWQRDDRLQLIEVE